ncbi:MAG: hypothetical protein ACTS1X_08685 [Parasphingopyxis sp.]|uniref:hypothetical protein n=1 Tax=Parasphingopyxis sp. TaxID=1920299 RepID=UPI003FA069C8
MTAHREIATQAGGSAGLDRIPQLYAVLGVVEQMAADRSGSLEVPDEIALCQAFDTIPGIARKGFDRVADEATVAATAGAQALIGKGGDSSAAAEELARYLRRRIVQLGRFAGL